MKRNIVNVITAGVVLLWACNNNAPAEDATAGDTAVVAAEPMATDLQQVAAAFPQAYRFFYQHDTSFHTNNFAPTQVDTLSNTGGLPLSPKQMQPFMAYLIYNADSSYAVDLYSYNVVIHTANGKAVAKNAGPDTEVGLINLKDSLRQRIYFGGASSAALDAKWLNNNVFLLLVGDEAGHRQFVPSVIKFDLLANTQQRFIYDDTLQVNASLYDGGKLQVQ